MSIFNTTPVYESVTYEEYDVAPTAEAGMSIAYEAARDITNLISGLYIADALAEHAVYEGTLTEAESVMEASVGEFKNKVKKKFIELRDKIVAWFKNVKTRILVTFMDIGKFVNKYEKDIIKKAATVKFSYDGYKYKKSPSGVGGVWITNLIDESDSLRNKFNDAHGDSDKFSDILSDLNEEYSVSKIKEKIDDECREKESIEVNISTAKSMIGFIKGYDKDIKAFTKNTDNIIKALNRTIKNLENTEKVMNNTENFAGANTTTKLIEANKRLITAAQAINAYVLDMLKNMYSTYGSVLKKVFNKKAVKESYEGDNDSGNSLLEQAMQMI